MRSVILEAILLMVTSVAFCEYGYHYYTFYLSCGRWPAPELAKDPEQNLSRILILSDTHIMGPIKSYKIDKLRREWVMKQSYGIMMGIYKPDLVIHLGDLLDEGSFSIDRLFEVATKEFDQIFPYHGEDRIMLMGNHDVGFHDQMTRFPYLMERFHKKFQTTSDVELIRYRDLDFVAINSMTFYNDSCAYCQVSKEISSRVSDILKQQHVNPRSTGPILLTHIPLYRKNDLNCQYLVSRRSDAERENLEGEDVLHKGASRFLLSSLKPRLVLSGHTHMDCFTNHRLNSESETTIPEITVNSYNHKFAERVPSFMLMSANSTLIYEKRCDIIDERVVFAIYMVTLVIIVTKIVLKFFRRGQINITKVSH